MSKEMEGDNRQRRQKAKEARDEGKAPSEEGVTLGASSQRRKLGNRADHPESLTAHGWGKAQPDKAASQPRPGSSPPAEVTGQPDTFPPKDDEVLVTPGELTEEDERVFETLARLEGPDEAPTLSEIAREAGLSRDEAEPSLQRLIDRHDVVQELPADAEVGRRYRVKAR